MYNKTNQVETGVNVCDRTLQNQFNKMEFTYRKKKNKQKIALAYKQKKMRLKWAKEKQ